MAVILIFIHIQKPIFVRNVFICKKQQNCETFLYTKSRTLFKKLDNFHYVFTYKKQDTLRYGIFHENFEVGIYIQKSWHFALRAEPRRKVESGDPGVAPRHYSRVSVFPSIFGLRFNSLLSLDGLTVVRLEGAKNTGYAWLSPATA